MISVKTFVCNPFGENTYVLYNEHKTCAIVDPGMDGSAEENAVFRFIKENGLKPLLLLNTHCHIDHVFGNKFIADQYGLLPQFHEGEVPVLAAAPVYAAEMGLRYERSPLPETFLPETGTVFMDDDALELIFAPGHSPAHLCFYSKTGNFLVGGDVLFSGSIGRTDLPGGDARLLITNIREKLFLLPDDCTVYPGHGEPTTIGHEKRTNPFLTRF